MSRTLRIFLVCQQDCGGAPHPVPAYRFWRAYFAGACAEAGHELIETPNCDWAAGLQLLDPETAHSWREITWAKTLSHLRREHSRSPIDLFLTYLYPQQIIPGALDEIRTLGLPCVNFFCDNVREFRRVPDEFRHFDLHWVPETKALPLYAQAGLPFLHAPMPCWIPAQDRFIKAPEMNRAVFIGTRDELRAKLLAEAFTHGLDAKLYGHGWASTATQNQPVTRSRVSNQIAFVQRHGIGAFIRKVSQVFRPEPTTSYNFDPYSGPVLTNTDYRQITQSALVCIGINRYPSLRHSSRRPDTYSRLRDLEAPMLGACYLTEWTEGLDLIYELGTEIETYRSADELVEKTKNLAGDPSRRARLRNAGQHRALSEHSIAQTLNKIIQRLGVA